MEILRWKIKQCIDCIDSIPAENVVVDPGRQGILYPVAKKPE